MGTHENIPLSMPIGKCLFVIVCLMWYGDNDGLPKVIDLIRLSYRAMFY
jgi:hypothetical protein